MPARPTSDRSRLTDLQHMTDLHYADKVAGGTRHYRRVPAKRAEAVQQLGSFQPDFVVELGDFHNNSEKSS